jgi:preprotein translocase subunit YajC
MGLLEILVLFSYIFMATVGLVLYLLMRPLRKMEKQFSRATNRLHKFHTKKA